MHAKELGSTHGSRCRGQFNGNIGETEATAQSIDTWLLQGFGASQEHTLQHSVVRANVDSVVIVQDACVLHEYQTIGVIPTIGLLWLTQ